MASDKHLAYIIT